MPYLEMAFSLSAGPLILSGELQNQLAGGFESSFLLTDPSVKLSLIEGETYVSKLIPTFVSKMGDQHILSRIKILCFLLPGDLSEGS